MDINATGDHRDQSPYTIEARILVATWQHESNKEKYDLQLICTNFSQRFDGNLPVVIGLKNEKTIVLQQDQ